MFQLHVLGSATLLRPDGTRAPLLGTQPKLLALLCYLVVGRGARAPRRDTLLAIFWPELDERGARHALSQALSVIRRELGPSVMDGKWRHTVQLAGNELWCDATALRRAVDEGRDAEALSLYSGPLLEGLHVPDAPEFEHWLDHERRVLARVALGAALRLAAGAATAGQWVEAAAWAGEATRLDPYDEGAWRARLSALGALGERTVAIAEFEGLSRRFAEELGIAASPELQQLMNAIRAGSVMSAAPVAAALPIAATPPPGEPPAHAPHPVSLRGRRFARRRLLLPLVPLIAAGAAALPLAERWRGAPRSSDPQVFAIFPFQVTDADTMLLRLARAMPLLLRSRLDAEAGPEPADAAPALVKSGREPPDRREGARIARTLGAGSAILGVIGSAPEGIAMSATIVDADTRKARAEFSVSGPRERVGELLDDLLAGALARAAGEPEGRLPHLLHAPLAAVQWYLAGQRHLHDGRSRAALDAFVRAIEHDTTFATAALAASIAAGAGGGPWLDRGVALAWQSRERLAIPDRELVRARLGPRYPQPSSLAERLDAWESLAAGARRHPYRYEVLYGYGDFLFHWGPLLGIHGAHQRARAVFEAAAALDHNRPGALVHLAEMAFINRDTAALRDATERLLARIDTDSTRAPIYWMRAIALGDRNALRAVNGDLDHASLFNLPQQSGTGIDAAERVAAAWQARATTLAEHANALMLQAELALNRGRPRLAATRLDSASRIARSAPHLAQLAAAIDRNAVLATLYWGGDTASLGPPLARLSDRVAAGEPADSGAADAWRADVCTLAQVRAIRGVGAGLPAAADALERGRPGARICAALLRAVAIAPQERPRAAMSLAVLDSLARRGAPGWEWTEQGNLVLARALEARGDTLAAFQAVRRRGVYYLRLNRFLSTYLAEQWRLGLIVGDTAAAIHAARHLLGLRESPEVELIGQRDSLRTMLHLLESRAPSRRAHPDRRSRPRE